MCDWLEPGSISYSIRRRLSRSPSPSRDRGSVNPYTQSPAQTTPSPSPSIASPTASLNPARASVSRASTPRLPALSVAVHQSTITIDVNKRDRWRYVSPILIADRCASRSANHKDKNKTEKLNGRESRTNPRALDRAGWNGSLGKWLVRHLREIQAWRKCASWV